MACGNLPYGLHQQLVVRGSPRHHGQYTTATAGQDYIMPSPAAAAAAAGGVVQRDQAEQQIVNADAVADWKDTCWQLLTCDGLCSGDAGVGPRRSKALMVDVISRVLFPIMFIVFNIVYWPIYLM